MIITNPIYENMFNSASREFVGRVEHLEGSTLLNVFKYDDALISFTVDITSDNAKMFGYGISQILTVNLRDKERAINIEKGQYLQAAYGIGNDYVYNATMFIVDEVIRDENTNELTIKALDPIYIASGRLVKELTLPASFTLQTFAIACGTLLGMPVNFINIPDNLLNVTYTREQLNFDGEETIRLALDNLAEMFGSIYYFCNNWNITFKRLDIAGEPVLTIDKSKYFELTDKTAITLANLGSVTELGDNISTTSGIPGETQFLRENAFLTLREDVVSLLNNILSATQSLTIQQFVCKHRGDFRLEIGDKIALVTKDDKLIYAYVLTDSLTYNGGLVGHSSWEYGGNSNETESNPTTLGDALKKTYAKVDKINSKIELVADDIEVIAGEFDVMADRITLTAGKIDEMEETVNGYSSSISNLQLESNRISSTVETLQSTVDDISGTVSGYSSSISSIQQESNRISAKIEVLEETVDGVTGVVSGYDSSIAALQMGANEITASVKTLEGTTQTSIDGIAETLETLTKEVATKMTSDQVTLTIKQQLDGGVDKITTTTGYVFDQDGLTISKNNSEMSTQITEDGMTIYRDNDEVLVADHLGVTARDLHATTYLKIGRYSRFEDYEPKRTGCFWMGG
jgi:uncharacterized protein YoxC